MRLILVVAPAITAATATDVTATTATDAPPAATTDVPDKLLVAFPLSEGSGSIVHDSSGHHLDGLVRGGASWTSGVIGGALQFNGRNSVRVPAGSLPSPNQAVSVSLWMRGRAESFRFAEGYSGIKGPTFQVCGDTIYVAGNSLVPADSDRHSAGFRSWNLEAAEEDLFTGTVDISLDDWEYRQRTHRPYTGLEPKLQVVGSDIYYAYFGSDLSGAYQVWLAQSRLDGSGWRAFPLTSEKPGYRVEQVDGIQVVGNSLYLSFPKLDSRDDWQIWTAQWDTKSGKTRQTQRTTDHGWLAAPQVSDGQVYYLFMKAPIGGEHFEKGDWLHKPVEIYIAVSDVDGADWRVLRRVTTDTWPNLTGWDAFKVHGNQIYLSYASGGNLYTASMDRDGTAWHATRRTSGADHVSPLRGGIQIVGNQIYYAYAVVKSGSTHDVVGGFTLPSQHNDQGEAVIRPMYEIWTARSNLDGTGWSATRRSASPPMAPYAYSYKALQFVGAKFYLGTTRINGSEDPIPREVLGVGGANLVSKGDAFGIGVTEEGEVRGFVNAGEDYLFRGEAPSDTGGAIADARLTSTELNFWHHVVMTYDHQALEVYIDGELKASTPYSREVATNPFPIVIGDGFQGAVSSVQLFAMPLSAPQVKQLYEEGRRAGR